MLVGKGALSFRTFEVSGKNSSPDNERLVEKLEQFAFSGLKSSEEGAAHGWVAPEHLFDGDFNTAKILRGRYAVFAFRIDTRKVSGPVLAAHTAIAIQAALEAEGVEQLGRKQKSELKRDVKRQLLADTPPAQRAYGVFWNIKAKRVFLQSTSKGVVDGFRELFERTFELNLEPHVPGLQAAKYARKHGVMPVLQDAQPLDLAFVNQPVAAA